MKNKKILFLLLILCLFTACLLFATAEEANIEDNPPQPKLVLQENNIQNNEKIESNKEKFEFQVNFLHCVFSNKNKIPNIKHPID